MEFKVGIYFHFLRIHMQVIVYLRRLIKVRVLTGAEVVNKLKLFETLYLNEFIV
jgi:hypothetical protein